MKCQICNRECRGNITIRDPNIEEGLNVCGDCLNDFGNQNYDNLIQKLEKSNKQKMIKKMEKKKNSMR